MGAGLDEWTRMCTTRSKLSAGAQRAWQQSPASVQTSSTIPVARISRHNMFKYTHPCHSGNGKPAAPFQYHITRTPKVCNFVLEYTPCKGEHAMDDVEKWTGKRMKPRCEHDEKGGDCGNAQFDKVQYARKPMISICLLFLHESLIAMSAWDAFLETITKSSDT